MKHLTSGSTTGDRCRCGAAVVAYYVSDWYRPGERVPIDPPMFWFFICERGHEQPAKAAVAEQMSFLEVGS